MIVFVCAQLPGGSGQPVRHQCAVGGCDDKGRRLGSTIARLSFRGNRSAIFGVQMGEWMRVPFFRGRFYLTLQA